MSVHNKISKSKLPIILSVVLVLFLLQVTSISANNDAAQFARNTNLALRRTAHQLLLLNGDSTSQIPPVQQSDASAFSVKISGLFEYEKLPEILQKSFDQYQIKRPYTVSVYNCQNGQLQLGYHFEDLGKKGGVTCAGRSLEAGCYTVQVNFTSAVSETKKDPTAWWILPFGGVLAALGLVVWNKSRHPKTAVNEKSPTTSGIVIGQSRWDAQNLTLTSAETVHQLTFREAKLLGLFIQHPNQVLERDFILKSVWEDEGVTVGRSVDVFVSRLRKMFSNDPTLKITAVHGVGYRFEIHS